MHRRGRQSSGRARLELEGEARDIAVIMALARLVRERGGDPVTELAASVLLAHQRAPDGNGC